MLHDVHFYVNCSSIQQLGKIRDMNIFPHMLFLPAPINSRRRKTGTAWKANVDHALFPTRTL